MPVSVLGPISIAGVNHLQLRDRTVLGVLVVRRGAVVSSGEIADALWADTRPASYRKVVQGSVVRLRRALGTAVILTLDGGYRLQLPDQELDASRFAFEVTQARELLANGRPTGAAERLANALSWWRGEPLSELVEWSPARAEARRLHKLREDAEDLLIEARLLSGHRADAVVLAQSFSQEAPFREPRWALWARALYADGRQAEALDVVERLRANLRDELGIDPSTAVVRLEVAILQQDPGLEVTPAVAPGIACPWPGLLPYQRGDLLYGRDADLVEVRSRLAASGALVIIGRSGCGKSSFVRALLAPALDARVVNPGPQPSVIVQELPCGPLIIDQGEEVLTLCADSGQRAAFFDDLIDRPGPVVLVVRADLLDVLAEYDGFAALLEGGLFVLRPLSVEGLRTMVALSAERAELRLEPGLIEVLLAECADQPAALPLLSHALAETWLRVEGNTMTIAGYRASGGVSAAVAATAERLYGELSPPGRVNLRRLLLRLVHLEDGEPRRGRSPRADYEVELVEKLVAERLISIDGDGDLMLAHEALARHWPRLMDWLAENQTEHRLLLRLATDARQWDRDGRPRESLYRGVRLDAVTTWAAGHQDDLASLELDFLGSSRNAVAEELRRAKRNNTRLGAALTASGVLLVAAIAGGSLAVQKAQEADAARASALQARDVSESLRLAGLAESVAAPSAAFALAAEALTRDDSPATRARILRVFARFPALLSTAVRPPGSTWPEQVAASVAQTSVTSPDGRLLAVAVFRKVTVTDVRSGQLVTTIQGVPTGANALAFDAASRLLAGGLSDPGFADTGTTIVWDVATGVEVGRFKSGDGPVWGHRFNSDGQSVYAYGADGLHRWDLVGSRSVARAASGDTVAFRAGDLLFTLSDPSVAPWVLEACRLAGRALTRSEWSEYVGDSDYRAICS